MWNLWRISTINGIEIAVLILQYIHELNDEDSEEYYMTEKDYAEKELRRFLEWLNKNQNRLISEDTYRDKGK